MIMALKCVARAGASAVRISAAQVAFAWIALAVPICSSAQSVQDVHRHALANVGREPTLDPGQTSTRVSDGRWLLIGGSRNPAHLSIRSADGTNAKRAHVSLAYPRKGHTSTLLPDGTVLIVGGSSPDDASLVTVVERFDPQSESLIAIENSGLRPRANHTATVLLDGRVFIVGGTDVAGRPVLDSELYDPSNGEVELITAQLDRGRMRHIAEHLQTHEVLLWNGTDVYGQPLASGSLYDTLSQYFTEISAAGVDQKLEQLHPADVRPVVVKTVPAAHEQRVSIHRPLVVQFNRPMDVTSLDAASVVLFGPKGPTPITPVCVENGRLLFVTAREDLMPGSNYTLFINDARDLQGQPLELTSITFSTETFIGPQPTGDHASAPPGSHVSGATDSNRGASRSAQLDRRNSSSPLRPSENEPLSARSEHAADAQSTPALDANSDRWVPTEKNRRGDWRSGRKHLAYMAPTKDPWLDRAVNGHPEIKARMGKFTPGSVSRAALAALVPKQFLRPKSGPTALIGQVVKLDGQPLAGVRISIGARASMTDTDGEFSIENAPSGHQVLVIDASNGRYARQQFGRYQYGVDIIANQRNVLPFKIWLTELDLANAVNIASPTTAPTVIKNPNIPGLELHLPVGTVVRDAEGKIVTQLSMTPIPIDQPPFPLPNFDVPVYFTIQPGGAHLEQSGGGVHPGAQLIYPNFTRSPPGMRMRFWNYDVNRGWHEYGKGTVSADGQKIIPDPGVVIHEFSGAMVSDPDNAPPEGPKKCRAGDPVDCYTGLFINDAVDLTIPDVIPIEVRRTYRNRDNTSRGFGVGTNLGYDFFIVGDTLTNGGAYTYQDLILPDGAHIHYTRISPGDGNLDAVYQNTTSPGKYYGSIIQWHYWPAWELTLRDGTKYRFMDSMDSNVAREAAVFEIEDRNGNALSLTRGSYYELLRVTSPSGRYIDFDYDQALRVIAAHDDTGRSIQYDYDQVGRLSLVTDQLSHTESFTYDSSNNMLTVTDKRGNLKVTNTYDSNDRVATQTYADTTTSSFAYTLDTNGAVTQTDFTDRRGTVKRIQFNSAGYPTSIISGLGLPEEQTSTISRSSTTNLVQSITDALGRTTEYGYDALGNVTGITKLAGTANAVSTLLEYSTTFSRPTKITDPNGKITHLSYNGSGDLIERIDPLNHSTTFTYDSQGRVLTKTNANNLVVATRSYLGGGTFTVTDALGALSSIEEESPGVVVKTDALGARTTFNYDSRDYLATIVDANGEDIGFAHDENGNVTAHTDARGGSTLFGYNSLDRVSSKTDALNNAESFLYEPGGKVRRRVDRKGQVSGATYDGLGRLVVRGYGATLANPTGYAHTITNTWDAGNRLTQILDSTSGTITRSYDDLNRLTSEITPQGRVDYTYDSGGRRTSMTVQGEPTVTYGWDDANRLTQMQQAAGMRNGFVAQTVTIQYDDLNRRSQTTLPNGIKASYTYDNANRLTEIAFAQASGAAIGNLTYTYNKGGRRTSVGGSLANVDLPAAVSSASYNANNQIAQWGGNSFSYDANGNVLSDGSLTYTWNARDQLTAIAGLMAGSFEYDAFGRRIGRTLNGNATGYVYDGANFIQEKSGTGATATVQASLLVGGIDEVFARVATSGTLSFLADAQGSIRAETNVSGSITTDYSYDAYGYTSISGASSPNSQHFVGRQNDGASLYFYRARYYSTQAGRFMSEDPIGWRSGQANNYAYVWGNPISFVDPFGLEGDEASEESEGSDATEERAIGEPREEDVKVDAYTGLEYYDAVNDGSTEDTTGAGQEAQQACDAAAQAAELEAEADRYRRKDDWDKYKDKMGQGWKQWLNYYRYMHTPLRE